jgi:hypothetical protein
LNASGERCSEDAVVMILSDRYPPASPFSNTSTRLLLLRRSCEQHLTGIPSNIDAFLMLPVHQFWVHLRGSKYMRPGGLENRLSTLSRS